MQSAGKQKSKTHVSLEDLIRLKADARGFSFLPRQPVNSLLSGRHTSRLRGRGLSFEELRRYQQGDDIRTIDWKATARLRTPHVRVYSEERERPVLLVVDQRSPMFFGSRRAMKSVAAAEAAALAAWRTLDSGDRVGGIIFNDQEMKSFRAERSQSRVLNFLNELARQNQELPKTFSSKRSANISINAVLESVIQVAKHDHLIVIISDLTGVDEETQRLAMRLQNHNDVIFCVVYDPLGAAIYPSPDMTASDDEGTIQIPDDKKFAEAYTEVFRDLTDHWWELLRSLKIPLFPLSTTTPVADQIRGLIGEQGD